jgi:DNA-binding NarL/FixJ family response regulator
VTNRVLIGDLDPLVARGLMQTLIEEHFDVLDATMTDHLEDLADAVVRLHPDAVIVRMTPEPEVTVRALRARQPSLQVVECDDDRPRLRVHPIGGVAYTLEPVTARTLREALSPSAPVVEGSGADVR